MKILLDECVTKRFKKHLSQYEVFTVAEKGWSGIKNGALLKLCSENAFDILLTIDKNLVFQQNVSKHPVTIVILKTRTSKIEELVTFLPSFNSQLNTFQKFRAYLIEKS